VRRLGIVAIAFDGISPFSQRLLASLKQGLAELGWVEGQNLRMDVPNTRREQTLNYPMRISQISDNLREKIEVTCGSFSAYPVRRSCPVRPAADVGRIVKTT
jgi:hypothetical protein